jgi:DNA ligase-1
MKQSFPMLFKKGSTGAIQFWQIEADLNYVGSEGPIGAGRVTTYYGQVGTDNPQATTDIVEDGTNIGRANERTAYEQGVFEAKAKWTKQKKTGYVETLGGAEAGETDKIIAGGISPMLAHKYAEQSHKIKWPAFVQPKLDGIRCVAMFDGARCTLWTRTRKPITSCPHIAGAIERLLGGSSPMVLDGELYNDALKKDFEKIVSAVRKAEPSPESLALVQFHIYDVVDAEDLFEDRTAFLRELFARYFEDGFPLKCVQTSMIGEADLTERFEHFLSLGYEGAMVRNADSLYENKRSYGLQKVKEFDADEYEVVGVIEGRGKLMGHVGSFVCQMKNGQTFDCKMSGDTARLKEYFESPSLWEGKMLTVKYQGLTNTNAVPRFPVGISMRDYE